jgi:hypothetical protein
VVTVVMMMLVVSCDHILFELLNILYFTCLVMFYFLFAFVCTVVSHDFRSRIFPPITMCAAAGTKLRCSMLLTTITPPSPIFFGSVAAADHSPPTLHLRAVLQVTFGYKHSSLAVLAVATCSRASSPLQLLQ